MTPSNRFKYHLSSSLDLPRGTLATTIGGVLAAGSLQAATVTVTTLEDGFIAGQCSLRAALVAANDNVPINGCSAGSGVETDRIQFAPGLSGTLSAQVGVPVQNFWDGSQLRITESVLIAGPTDGQGANSITVEGTGAAPVFYITPAADQVTLEHLTITGGFSPEDLPGRPGHGGAVLSYGRILTLDGTVISNNGSARRGGGVWHDPTAADGVLIAADCRFDGNVTARTGSGRGGAMAVSNSVVSINGCHFEENQTGGTGYGGSGGAVSIGQSSLSGIANSTFLRNTATYGSGGGVALDSTTGQVYLGGNVFNQNVADLNGGGLSLLHSPNAAADEVYMLFVQNDFFGNESFGDGGGLYLQSGPGELQFRQVDFDNNQALRSGGGAALRLDGTDLDWRYGGFFGNTAAGLSGGGGLALRSSDNQLDFTRVAWLENIAEDGCGGGMTITPQIGFNGPQSLEISDSILFRNSALCGGGLDLFLPISDSIQVLFDNNEWARNEALGGRLPGDGGALFADLNEDSVLVMSNSTISGNEAIDSGGGVFAGGGTTLSLKYSTLANNQTNGSGRHVRMTGTACGIRNSILAGTEASAVDSTSPCDLNFSLIENPTGSNLAPGEGVLSEVDPQLGPLRDNGGTAWSFTHKPNLGSPVIDAGDASISAPQFDQRGDGFPRVLGTALDLGAMEREGSAIDRIFSDRFDDAN